VRPQWSDRFRQPSEAELLDAISRQFQPAFEHARTRLGAWENSRETIEWRGVWHWTFVCRVNGEHEPAWGYLVPDPARPRVCLPFPDELLTALPPKRLAKAVRDTLIHAPSVSGVRWPTWDVQSKAQIDEVMTLAEFKSTSMTKTR